jgi:uracil-DNA glycosylase
MPLNKSCSLEALRENITAEIGSGTPRDQAVAVAYSTLRRACSDEGKPIPSSKEQAGVVREFKRKRGERGQEYLEAALTEARKLLTHRSFSMLHQAARSSAGGRVSARARMTSVEKALVLGPEWLSDTEFDDAVYRVDEMQAADLRRGVDQGTNALASLLWKEEKRRAAPNVRKGFYWGTSDGGVHAHGLVRTASKTRKDGAHCHYFRMPGTGAIMRTNEDGAHEHAIADSGLKTPSDGAHSHRIVDDFTTGETPLGGSHVHDLLFETSGFGGQHTHEWKLRDGTVIVSSTLADELEQAKGALTDSPPLPEASKIIGALQRVALLEAELRDARLASTAQLARSIGDAALSPSAPAVVVSMSDGEVEVHASDGNMLVECELDAEPGDMVEIGSDLQGMPRVEGPSLATAPASIEQIVKSVGAAREYKLHTTRVPFHGPDDAPMVFVAGCPSELELARGEALVGPDGVVFVEAYLAPLRLTKSQVAFGFAYPFFPNAPLEQVEKSLLAEHDWLDKNLERWPKAKIVALGRTAKAVLAGRAVLSLPHPAMLRVEGKTSFAEEARRKVRALAKSLDSENRIGHVDTHQKGLPHGESPGTLAAVGELKSAGQIQVRILKAADEKQIVYGVVLDPYMVDTQGEWVPPAEIESTAHGFVKKSRVIGVEHSRKANAQLVESFVVPYPTAKDYQAALSNLPHEAYEMPYGTDSIHSGAWVAGAELGKEEWAAYKRGEISGFSIGGFSFRTTVPLATMPAVKFLKLAPIV